jgi:hypothetical protein
LRETNESEYIDHEMEQIHLNAMETGNVWGAGVALIGFILYEWLNTPADGLHWLYVALLALFVYRVVAWLVRKLIQRNCLRYGWGHVSEYAAKIANLPTHH